MPIISPELAGANQAILHSIDGSASVWMGTLAARIHNLQQKTGTDTGIDTNAAMRGLIMGMVSFDGVNGANATHGYLLKAVYFNKSVIEDASEQFQTKAGIGATLEICYRVLREYSDKLPVEYVELLKAILSEQGNDVKKIVEAETLDVDTFLPGVRAFVEAIRILPDVTREVRSDVNAASPFLNLSD